MVTSAPSRRHTEPSSSPIMPAPTISSFSGTLAQFQRAGRGHDALLVDLDAVQRRDIGARGDDDGLGFENLRLAVSGLHFDLAGRRDLAGADEALDLVLLEQIVDAFDVAVDALLLVFEHRCEIDRRLADLDAHVGEFMRGFLVKLRGIEHRLRRDAADIEAGAAEGRHLLDDGGLHAELRRANGADITAGTGTDNDEIVSHEVTPKLSVVMAGLVPAIHVLRRKGPKDVDTRRKAGHDG